MMRHIESIYSKRQGQATDGLAFLANQGQHSSGAKLLISGTCRRAGRFHAAWQQLPIDTRQRRGRHMKRMDIKRKNHDQMPAFRYQGLSGQ